MSLASVLDACLEDIRIGKATVEDCLALHPDYADELAPLLEMAMLLEGIEAPQPSPSFQAGLRRQLMSAPVPPRAPWPTRLRAVMAGWLAIPAVAWGSRLAVGFAVLLFLVIFLSTSTFASSALPDTPLYTVKRVGEQVRLLVAFDDYRRAQVHAVLAEVRRQEAQIMLARGNTLEAQALLKEAASEAAEAKRLAGAEPSSATPTPSSGIVAVPPTSTSIPALAPSLVPTSAPSATQPATAAPRAPAVVNAAASAQQAAAQPSAVPSVTPVRRSIVQPVDVPTDAPTDAPAPPTVDLPKPTDAAAYPSPEDHTSAYPEPDKPTKVPPTATPEFQRPVNTVAPLVTRTPTRTSNTTGPGTPTAPPPPTATSAPPIRPTERPPVALPTKTSVPPTSVPPTSVPPTSVPPTSEPPANPTDAPAPTSAPQPTSPPANPTSAPAPTSAPKATTLP
ncbi:MAG: DUF5667 domain-containing protein [Anaerolineae bacterium]